MVCEKKSLIHLLVDKFGEKYSEALRIRLETLEDGEIFKWFLASILFGAPIRETSAIKTYKCFERNNVLSPQGIINAGWGRLVQMLDEGGYTRYDYKTSDKLLEVAENLISNYGGSLNTLHERALDSRDLEKRLMSLAKGVGKTTVAIFLRELRGLWSKADPELSSISSLAARNLGLTKKEKSREILDELRGLWSRYEVAGKSFVNFETALLRLGKDHCKKRRCKKCLFKNYCLKIIA